MWAESQKNLDRLVELFRERTDVQLKVVGDGPYRKRMQAALRNARFEGFLTGRVLAEAYASADVFVFPSTADTFGNVVLEAMASGLPAIVTNQMGPKELVLEGENGFITRIPGEFAQRLDWLVSHPEDRRIMADKARKAAVSRTWQAVFKRLFADYQEMVRCSRSTQSQQQVGLTKMQTREVQ